MDRWKDAGAFCRLNGTLLYCHTPGNESSKPLKFLVQPELVISFVGVHCREKLCTCEGSEHSVWTGNGIFVDWGKFIDCPEF